MPCLVVSSHSSVDVGRAAADTGGACRYVVYFKCNRQFIHQFPNLARLTRDVYHTPGKQLCLLAASSISCLQPASACAVCLMHALKEAGYSGERLRLPLMQAWQKLWTCTTSRRTTSRRIPS